MGFFSSSQNSPKPGSLAGSLQPYLLQRDKLLASYKKQLRLEALTKSLLSLDNPSKQDIQHWAANTNITPSEFQALQPVIKEIEDKKKFKIQKTPSGEERQINTETGQTSILKPGEHFKVIMKEDGTIIQKNTNTGQISILAKPEDKKKYTTQVLPDGSIVQIEKSTGKETVLRKGKEYTQLVKEDGSIFQKNIHTGQMSMIKGPNKSSSSKISDDVPKWTKTVTNFAKTVSQSEEPEAEAKKYKELVPELINRVNAKAKAENISPEQAVFPAITDYVNEQKTRAQIQSLIPRNDNAWFGSGNYNIAQDTVIQLAGQGVPIQTLGEELEKKGWTDSQVKEFLSMAINFKTLKEAGIDPKRLAHTSVPEGGSFIDSKGNAWERKGRFLVNKINGWTIRYDR